jgi:hypothetical protein
MNPGPGGALLARPPPPSPSPRAPHCERHGEGGGVHGIGGVEEESGEMFGGGGGKEFSSQEEVVFGMVSSGYQVHIRDGPRVRAEDAEGAPAQSRI